MIHYAFQVQNAGNVSLKNFQMVDLLAGAAVAVGNPALQLTPGQVDTTTFTATYTITTQDETERQCQQSGARHGRQPNPDGCGNRAV